MTVYQDHFMMAANLYDLTVRSTCLSTGAGCHKPVIKFAPPTEQMACATLLPPQLELQLLAEVSTKQRVSMIKVTGVHRCSWVEGRTGVGASFPVFQPTPGSEAQLP